MKKKGSSSSAIASPVKWVQTIVIFCSVLGICSFIYLLCCNNTTADSHSSALSASLQVQKSSSSSSFSSSLREEPHATTKADKAPSSSLFSTNIAPDTDLFYSIYKDEINDIVTHVVDCQTTKGNITIDVRKHWAPKGADQFLKLVDHDAAFFKDLPFFRVCPRYITQFGARTNLRERKHLTGIEVIPDDPNMVGKRDMGFGYVFFAGSGMNSRREELVISFCHTEGCKQTGLGKADWETPFATIRADNGGFDVLHRIESSGKPYPRLEMPGLSPNAGGPDRGKLEGELGYLEKNYPYMEYFVDCKVTSRNVNLIRPIDIPSKNGNNAMKSSEQKHDTNEHVENNNSNSNSHLQDHHQSNINSNSQHVNNNNNNNNINNNNNNNIVINNNPKDGPVDHHLRKGVTTKEIIKAIDGNPDDQFVRMVVRSSGGTGEVIIQIKKEWAPLGAERFLNLVKAKFYNENKVFRVIPKFMAQFGINGDPSLHKYWNQLHIQDDPAVASNTRGTISFATSGKDTRSTQVFINFVNNKYLDKEGFSPFGEVISGMEYVDSLYGGYGEGGKGDGSDHKGPAQGRITREGNIYLEETFPLLSSIVDIAIL